MTEKLLEEFDELFGNNLWECSGESDYGLIDEEIKSFLFHAVEEARHRGRRELYDAIKVKFLLTKGLLCIEKKELERLMAES